MRGPAVTPAQERVAHREAAAKLRGRPRYADVGRWPDEPEPEVDDIDTLRAALEAAELQPNEQLQLAQAREAFDAALQRADEACYGIGRIGDTRAALRLLDVLADDLVEARRGQQALPGVDVTCAAED